MSESQPLLSEAELAALSSGVSSGEIATDTGFNTEASVRKHDLASEDSSLCVNVASLDMINERFIRLFRLGMLESLRISPRINPTQKKSGRKLHSFFLTPCFCFVVDGTIRGKGCVCGDSLCYSKKEEERETERAINNERIIEKLTLRSVIIYHKHSSGL